MADTPTFQSNPYASFDPSQYTNPYSNFFGKALPWPSSYAGTPNNALGQPIQPPPGMTLNQTPAQPQQAPQAAAPMLYGPASAVNPNGGLTPQRGNVPMPGGGQYMSQQGYQTLYGGGQGQPGATAAPAQAAAPNNWQSTLSMLANPGHVTTPGATVPQAQSSTGVQPGVLQNFLANWKPQQSGAGSGFTQNFNSILRGLQAQKGS